MNYQQFTVVVKEKLAVALGEGMSLQIHTALKNNGRERVGVTISDKRVNLSPTIYLEEYYKQFQNGLSIEDIVESILGVYHEVKFEHSWNVHTLKEFHSIQSKIVYKIIHANKNESLLQTLPYIAYLDFAIVFYILFEVNESGTATVPISHDLLKLWDVTLEDLQQVAFRNTPKLLPATFKPMQVVINELLGNILNEEVFHEEFMYVLTNNLRSFGAACILYDGVLEDIGNQLNENYYVLPSSIHEMIIISESQCPTREHLDEMVAEINETQIDEEDVLSNRVYYFNRATQQLS